MGWRTTVFLLLIVAGVGALLWVEGAPAPELPREVPNLLGEPRLRDPSDFTPLLVFEPAQVTAIRLSHDGIEFTAERSAQSWAGPHPAERIEELLRNLSELGRILEIPVTDEDLDDYGLAPPKSVLELSLAAQETPIVLEVGNQNPATTGVYARLDRQGPVILAGALLPWELDKLLRSQPD